MVLAQIGFAGMNLFTRIGARDLPFSEVAAARFLVGAAVAILLARARGTSLRVIDRPNTWRRSIFGTCSALGHFYALSSQRIPLGDAATLGATAPIFVALLSRRFLGERVGRRIGVAVVIAFIGVMGVVRPTFAAAADVAVVATTGAFFYALAMIWLRKIGPGESGEAIVLHFSLVACATMVLISIPVWVTPTGTGALWLLATGLCGGLGQIAMTRAYTLDRAARVSTVAYLGIALTHLLAILVFGDLPTLSQVGGAALVVASGAILAQGARPARTRRTGDAEAAILDQPRL
jgi:drug/metabolite transporter (DMT)-like permease